MLRDRIYWRERRRWSTIQICFWTLVRYQTPLTTCQHFSDGKSGEKFATYDRSYSYIYIFLQSYTYIYLSIFYKFEYREGSLCNRKEDDDVEFRLFRTLFDRRRNDRDIKIKIVVVDIVFVGRRGQTENGSKDVVQSSVLIKRLSR